MLIPIITVVSILVFTLSAAAILFLNILEILKDKINAWYYGKRFLTLFVMTVAVGAGAVSLVKYIISLL